MQPAWVTATGILVRSSLLLVLHVLGWLFVQQLIWPAGELTLIWPPAAVAYAGLLLFGLRYWPVVALACTVVELQHSGSHPIGSLLSIGGPTVGAIAGVWLCRRLAGGRELTGLSVRDLWLLLLGALLLGATSGLFGTLGAVWFPVGAPVQPLRFWLAWLLGDLLGIVVCTPALLSLHHVISRRQLSPLDRPYSRPLERWAWLLVTSLSLWVLLGYGVHAAAPVQGLAFLPLALLAWSALRLEPLFTSVSVAVLGLSFAALSSLGIGGFETPHNIGDSAIVALFLATLAALPHLLSAAEYGRRQLLAELADQAHRDDLTGLLNRRGFQSRLKALLKQNQSRGEHVALVHLDLDQFKLINDACGAEAGDAFLAQIGSVLAAHLRSGDQLARIGGDEFALLWRHTDQAAADRRADELLQLVEAFRFPSRGRVLSLTGSIGLVCVALQGQSPSQLEREATTAAQTAKEQGGNRVKRVIGIDLEVRRRQDDMQWAVMLSEAMEQNRFRLFAQRIVPLAGHADGLLLEVLVRMDDGSGHLLAPGRFIPAAERYGLAARLDRHVLRQALSWFSTRREVRDRIARLNINLSAASLGDEELLPYLQELLASTGFPPQKLCLEITETDAIRDLARTRKLMESLRADGVRFALDDFGSGFCSFGYLRTLPVDYVKIDGSFVRDLANDPGDRAIVRAIVEVAKSLGKQTVAECVENEAARAMVAALEVDYAQGYATHRPEMIETLFDTRRLASQAL